MAVSLLVMIVDRPRAAARNRPDRGPRSATRNRADGRTTRSADTDGSGFLIARGKHFAVWNRC